MAVAFEGGYGKEGFWVLVGRLHLAGGYLGEFTP